MKPRPALKPAAPRPAPPQPIRQSGPQRRIIIQQRPANSSAIIAGWIVLFFGYVLALVPGLGLSMLLISIPVCTAAGLLGVFGAAGGKPLRGVLLILSSIVSFVLFLLIPWLSAFVGLWFGKIR